MGREQFSATQSATDPVLPCEKGMRPIFPVRFAIKPSVLTELSLEPRTINAETDIVNTGDHELRRIRQGYLYIFVPNEIEDVESRTEASNGYWMVFRYQSQLDDFNSPVLDDHGHIPFSIRNPDTDPYVGANYSFRQYTWLDGYAAGRWGFNNSKIYPYAYVPKQVTKIEIAYSEHRWPAKFFEQAEADAEFRKKLMVPIDLAPQQTDFTLPLSELENHVVDFKQELFTLNSLLTDYADCHTGVYPQNPQDVLSCVKEQENARIVALHDPVGRVLDINERIHKNDNERMVYNAEYQYPLVTARAVEQIHEVVNDANWLKKSLNDDILHDQKHWTYYLEQCEEFDDIAVNLYKAHKFSIGHSQSYSIHHQINAGLELLKGSGDESDCELMVYCSGLLLQLFEGVSNSVKGSEYLQATLAHYHLEKQLNKAKDFVFGKDDRQESSNAVLDWVSSIQPKTTDSSDNNIEEGNSLISETFNSLISSWAKVAYGVNTGVKEMLPFSLKAKEAFDSFLLFNGPELAKLRLHYHNPELMKILDGLFTVKGLSKRPLTLSEVKKVFNSGFTPKNVRADSGQAHVAHNGTSIESKAEYSYQASTSKKSDVIDVYFVEFNGDFVPAAGFETRANQIESNLQHMAGLAIFLNLITLFDIIDQRNNKTAKTTLGKIGEDFYLNLVVAVGATLNDTYETAKVFRNGQFQQTKSKELVDKIFKQSKKPGLFQRVTTTANRVRTGSVSGIQVSKFAGKALGIVGIALTSFMAYEGFKSNNKAKGYGNTLAAIGSGLLMLTPFLGPFAVIGGALLIIAGMVMEYVGTLNPIEDWAYNCFWGKSDYYWGDDERRGSMSTLVKRSKVLAQPDKESYQWMSVFFEKEVRAFENLFLGLKVQNVSHKGRRFEVVLPRVPTSRQVLKLSILVKEELYLISMDKYGNKTVREIHKAKQYGYQEGSRIVTVDLTQRAWKDLPLVKVDINYTDDDGEVFTLNDQQIYKSSQSAWMRRQDYKGSVYE